jgi:hypothetical protein
MSIFSLPFRPHLDSRGEKIKIYDSMKFLHSKGGLIAMSVQKSDAAPHSTGLCICALLFWSFALPLSGSQERKNKILQYRTS